MGQHPGARLAGLLNEVLDRIELTDSRLLGITTDNASSNYSMIHKLQTTYEASEIEWPALRKHISCMAHVIQRAVGAFMSSLGVKGRTKSWEAYERNQQFGENESTDIGKSQRLRKEGDDRINKVSAMRPGWAKIIEKVRISRYFESPETDLHIAENACCIDYTDTWSSKRVHWLSKSQSPHHWLRRHVRSHGWHDATLAKKKIQWKEDLYFAVKFAWQKLSKYSTDVTPTTGMILISAHILDPFRKLQSFRKWDRGMDITSEDETSYTQYQEAFLKYVQNKYCAKHKSRLVTKPETIRNNNLVSSTMPSRSGQQSYDPYDSSSDDEEYLMLNNVAKTTPRRNNCAARLLTAARLYMNSPPVVPQNWGQVNMNPNDYHSDPMEISSTLSLPDITNWWWQKEEMHAQYADLSNVAHNIFSIIPHGVGVEASCSLGRDVIGWRQSKTTGETLREMVAVREFARTNTGLQPGDDPVLDSTSTDTNMEMKRETEQKKLHRVAKVHDLLEMSQGSQYLRATQKKSRAQNTQMKAVGSISDTEEIVKASWSHFQHDGAAAFKFPEKSPVSLALSAKDLPGGRTQLLNVRRIKWINRHPAKSDKDI